MCRTEADGRPEDLPCAPVPTPPGVADAPTLMSGGVGSVAAVRRCIARDRRAPGQVLAIASARVERAGLDAAKAMHQKVAGLIAGGKVKAAHDVSDGGLAVAVAALCIASHL